jgi:4'-phosphopantetheinyl transferase EntD
VIAALVPGWVEVAEAAGDRGEDALLPAEAALIAGFPAARRAEFGAVRACARRALARLGVPPVPILPGERGAPQWPDGIVGSMTHCPGYRAAAVAPVARVAGIGVDAEPHLALPAGVLDVVALPGEQVLLAALRAGRPEVHWDRVLFSIKESVYKAWFPLTGRWLDFGDVSVRIEESGLFVAGFEVPAAVVGGRELPYFPGRFAIEGGLICTAVVLPAAAQS